jgi:hypothetical protein
MKILITEKQQKLIKENFYEDQKYRMFIDMLGLMIDNYDSIDCENPVKKYETMFCENMSDWEIGDLKKKIDFFINKLDASTYKDMYNN